MNISERIKDIRTARGLSQTFVARKLGVSMAVYNNMERGRSDLRASWIPRLAKIFECKPGDFFEENINNTLNIDHTA